MAGILEQTTDQIEKIPWLIRNLEEVGIGVGVVVGCFVLYYVWPRFAEGLAQIIRAFRG